MPEGFAVSPAEVVRLAGAVLDGADQLGGAAARFAGDASTGAAAFGNLGVSGRLAAACLDAQASAGTAADGLVGTLEGDVDRLYQVAFAYQEAEQSAAARFRSRGRWGPR